MDTIFWYFHYEIILELYQSYDLIDKYHQNRIVNFLKLFNLENIIDVGSHKGEFLSYALQLNEIKKIYAFEPQIEINKILTEKFVKLKFQKKKENLSNLNFN